MKKSKTKAPASKRLDYDQILQDIKYGSSRSSIILGVAFIDDVLRVTITLNFIKLSRDDEDRIFSGDGPLATFSSRIRVAYAMGLISRKLRSDLDRLRKIRNEYAHKALNLRLTDEEHDNTIRGLNAVSCVGDAAHLSTKEMLSIAIEKICLYLILRTSPSSMIADVDLVEELSCLDFSNGIKAKRKEYKEPHKSR